MFLHPITPSLKRKRLKEYSDSAMKTYCDEIKLFLEAYKSHKQFDLNRAKLIDLKIDEMEVQYALGKLPKLLKKFILSWKKAVLLDVWSFYACCDTSEFENILEDIQSEFGVDTEKIRIDKL
jgi:hypothetical protein